MAACQVLVALRRRRGRCACQRFVSRGAPASARYGFRVRPGPHSGRHDREHDTHHGGRHRRPRPDQALRRYHGGRRRRPEHRRRHRLRTARTLWQARPAAGKGRSRALVRNDHDISTTAAALGYRLQLFLAARIRRCRMASTSRARTSRGSTTTCWANLPQLNFQEHRSMTDAGHLTDDRRPGSVCAAVSASSAKFRCSGSTSR